MTDPKTIADPKVQEFIVSHEDTDLSVLLLSGKSVAAIPTSELVDQIRSRNKARKKLPQWYEATGIVYPPPLSLEQASSEETAAYKAEILAKKVIDYSILRVAWGSTVAISPDAFRP